LLYINDLPLTVADSAINLYADDSSLYKTVKHNQDVQINLQHNIDQVAKWCKKNNMSLNSDKTKSMVICNRSRLSIVEDLEIKVNNYVIEYVEYQNVLGVIVDKILSWYFHVNAYILPLFDYCSVVWGNCQKGNEQNKLFKVTEESMQNYISVFKR